jgi:hypothetical protein
MIYHSGGFVGNVLLNNIVPQEVMPSANAGA